MKVTARVGLDEHRRYPAPSKKHCGRQADQAASDDEHRCRGGRFARDTVHADTVYRAVRVVNLGYSVES